MKKAKRKKFSGGGDVMAIAHVGGLSTGPIYAHFYWRRQVQDATKDKINYACRKLSISPEPVRTVEEIRAINLWNEKLARLRMKQARESQTWTYM
jgi:hypothetical protein